MYLMKAQQTCWCCSGNENIVPGYGAMSTCFSDSISKALTQQAIWEQICQISSYPKKTSPAYLWGTPDGFLVSSLTPFSNITHFVSEISFHFWFLFVFIQSQANFLYHVRYCSQLYFFFYRLLNDGVIHHDA